MNKTLLFSCALALAGLSNVALAADDSAVFLRVEAGHSEIDVDLVDDDTDSTTSFRGGYYFTPNFAVEAFVGTQYDGDIVGYETEFFGYGIGGIAKKNFGADNTGFFINGRAGIMRAHAEFGGYSDDETEPYLGVGLGYDFTREFGVSLNYDVVQTDFDGLDTDVETLTAGVEYRF
jgi:opacity protein-like surface antigen